MLQKLQYICNDFLLRMVSWARDHRYVMLLHCHYENSIIGSHVRVVVEIAGGESFVGSDTGFAHGTHWWITADRIGLISWCILVSSLLLFHTQSSLHLGQSVFLAWCIYTVSATSRGVRIRALALANQDQLTCRFRMPWKTMYSVAAVCFAI